MLQLHLCETKFVYLSLNKCLNLLQKVCYPRAESPQRSALDKADNKSSLIWPEAFFLFSSL